MNQLQLLAFYFYREKSQVKELLYQLNLCRIRCSWQSIRINTSTCNSWSKLVQYWFTGKYYLFC